MNSVPAKYMDKVPLLIGLATLGGVAWYILNELDKQKKEVLALRKEIVNLKSLLTYQVNNTRPLQSAALTTGDNNPEDSEESETDEEYFEDDETLVSDLSPESGDDEEDFSSSEKNNTVNQEVPSNSNDLEGNQNSNKNGPIRFNSKKYTGGDDDDFETPEGVNFEDVIRSRISSMTAIIGTMSTTPPPPQTATITELPDSQTQPEAPGNDADQNPQSDTESTDTDDGQQTTCVYMWKNGKRKGTVCGEDKTTGSKYCSNHKYQMKKRRKRMEKKALAAEATDSDSIVS